MTVGELITFLRQFKEYEKVWVALPEHRMETLENVEANPFAEGEEPSVILWPATVPVE